MLSITVLVLIGSRPLNAIDFVFCTDIFKPYSVIILFNLAATWNKNEQQQDAKNNAEFVEQMDEDHLEDLGRDH